MIWLVSPDGNVAPEPPINLVTPSPAKGLDNASPGSCAGSSNVPQPNYGSAAAGVPARNNTVKRMLQLSPEAGKADMAAAPSSRHDPAPTVITCMVGSIPGGATQIVLAAALNSLGVPGRHFVAKRRQDTVNELVSLDHNPG